MAGLPDELAHCTGIQWDAGNSEKNWERHRVSRGEAEQVFFQRPLVIAAAVSDLSLSEPRFAALGQSAAGRPLTVVFTVRRSLIRVISARDMSRQERRVYERPQEG